jgi:hypothetical protein
VEGVRRVHQAALRLRHRGASLTLKPRIARELNMASQSIPDEEFQRKLGVLAKMTASQLCAWLLRGFSTGRFGLISLLSDPSPPLQIEQLFLASQEETRSTLKQGVALALAEWTPAAYQYTVFSELARTAAALRATQAVPHIAQHLLSPAFEERDDSAEDACETAISVLHGFVPHESVYATFLVLHRSENFERYIANFFLALCECAPAKYMAFVPQFLQVLKRRKDDFEVRYIMQEFERFVPQEFVQEGLTDLILNSRRFVDLIANHTRIALMPAVPARPSDTQQGDLPAPDAGTVYDYHARHVEEVGVPQMLDRMREELDQKLMQPQNAAVH